MSTPEPTPVAAQSESHPCPKCGGKMNFDAAKGTLLCPFCGHTMAVPQAAAQQATISEHDLEAALKDASGKAQGYGTQLKSIKCQSCGAVLNVEPNITSTQCSFCGSNQVLEQQVDPNLYRPESLLPFAIDDSRSQHSVPRLAGARPVHAERSQTRRRRTKTARRVSALLDVRRARRKRLARRVGRLLLRDANG